MINGSDSTIFPPFRKSSDSIYIFMSDVCRSLNAEYERDVKVEGVPALRFLASKNLFTSGEEYAPNMCFCDGKKGTPPEKRVCLKSGALDLYNCLEVPVVITYPHFYRAATEYLNYVEGLHPQKGKHVTFSDIEPNTGITLQGAKRIQMNMFLTKISQLNVLKNVSQGLFPVLWLEEGVQLGEEYLSKFRRFAIMLSLFSVLKWLVPAAGLLLLCFTCYKCKTTVTRQRSNRVVVTYDNKAYVNRPETVDPK
ncbi:hypothetical protein L9F63_020779 [Diploptera punctata]|uniref:Sensory neuron membrane protein 1 n=1 Tax=Diploptera punctata TaxID=6984 RepID=A0AAD8ECK6_DIPPU|nr:hypothetical protein L9F63_020779 [Diploptera punctata]